MKCAICYFGFINMSNKGFRNIRKKDKFYNKIYINNRINPDKTLFCIKKHLINCNKNWNFDY